MTLEFTYNDERDGGYTKPSRQAFEQLLRKLLRLPSRCGVPRSCGCVVARSMAGLASLLGLAPATNPLPTTWNACCMPTPSPCNPACGKAAAALCPACLPQPRTGAAAPLCLGCILWSWPRQGAVLLSA